MAELQPVLGLGVLIAVAWLVGGVRRAFPWRLVAAGLAIQFAVALILIRMPGSQQVFVWFNDGVLALQKATEAGTALLFGFLGGGALPFEEPFPGAAFVFAFRALPMVLVVSALSALLYHWRILPWVVRLFAWALSRALRIGGPASFATAGNIFVGNIEAPLLIRPYLERLSRPDLFIVMTAGLATIAGTVFVLYASFLSGVIPNAAGHLLTASIISAPAAVMIARLMMPADAVGTDESVGIERRYDNSMDAVTRGAVDGLQLLAYIIAMVLVLVALVALLNIILGLLPEVAGAPLTLQRMFGWLLAPVAWLMGVPWDQAATAGSLLGTKIVLNELVSYLDMAGLPEGGLDGQSSLIMTYAMCGFANFGGLGVMIGGLSAIVPSRRDEIVGLGMRALLAGNLATFMTGAVAGLVA